jgi:hypothetical protein
VENTSAVPAKAKKAGIHGAMPCPPSTSTIEEEEEEYGTSSVVGVAMSLQRSARGIEYYIRDGFLHVFVAQVFVSSSSAPEPQSHSLSLRN